VRNQLFWGAILVVLGAGEAQALTFGGTSTQGLSMDAGIEVYGRGRTRRPDGGEVTWDAQLTRARLKLSFRYGTWIRADLEPDFGGGEVDLADAFLAITPIQPLEIRLGQAKTPFGVLEIEGRWRLPAIRRGLISDVVMDRLGFGRRKFGGKLSWKERSLLFKPELELGIYADSGEDQPEDIAGRLSAKLTKGLEVHLSGYSRAGAGTGDARGHAGAVSALFDRKAWYLTGEFLAGRARLLSVTGVSTGVDANFLGVRLLGSYRFKPSDDHWLEPFLGGELYDPNLSTRDDRNVAYRLGLNYWWIKRFRLAAEYERQTGELGAVARGQSTVSVFAGIRLE